MRYHYSPGPRHVPTVALIHGLGNSLDFWTAVAPRVSRRFSTLAVDLPGFGESSDPPGSLTLEHVSRATVRLLNHIATGPIVLVGHSLGGIVALHIAQATHLERVRRVILVDATLFTALEILQQPRSILRHPLVAAATALQFLGGLVPLNAARARLLFRSAPMRALTLWPYAARPWTLQADLTAIALSGNRGRGICAAVAAARTVNLAETFAALQAPVDLVWGARDPMVTGADIATAIALADVQETLAIPGCRHWPMLEAPAVLSDFIMASASRHEGA